MNTPEKEERHGNEHAGENVRVAAAQTPEFREDIEAALACLADLAEQSWAQGVRLLCLSECFLGGGT